MPVLSFQDVLHMASKLSYYCCVLVYLHACVVSATMDKGNVREIHILDVGEELQRENIPLKKGHCTYLLRGLKPSMWYEVKISYPASIPASFSIQLQKGEDGYKISLKRRLLNTEKLIFEADINHLGKTYILVTVEPAGVVALPDVTEREFVVFNIVCDELLVGIPYKAWWVGILALVCIGVAVILAYYLPPRLLLTDRNFQSGNWAFSKDS